MSHYTLVETKMTEKEHIVKALKRLGFSDAQIEVSDSQNLELKTYSGGSSGKRCEIRIKGAGWRGQSALQGLVNDFGFEKLANGSYRMHVDEMGMHKFGKDWRTKLTDYYSAECTKTWATEHGYYVEEESERNGELYLRVSSPY